MGEAQMTGLEEAAASAAIAQVKGFVDALINPTVHRVRQWALDRDLKRQLGPDRIVEVTKRYLERTLTVAANIQSVVFPQVPLLLSKAYEPLQVESIEIARNKSKVLSASELIQLPRHTTIVDQAGMGKSTFSKYLIVRICEQTDKLPILFNLRNYQAGEPIEKALLREFHEFDKIFGEQLFNKLLVIGKFHIIFDGFDEIAPRFQSDVREELERFAVKCGGTRITLTSRPQNNIPILAGSLQLKFKRLSLSQAHSLLRRYDKFAELNVGERLIRQLHVVPQELLETPLLVALLYRTFGFNNSIAEKITVFYGETFEALFKGHDLTKAGFSREKESELDIDEFRRFLQLIAFNSIVKGKITWDTEQELVDFIDGAIRRKVPRPDLPRKLVHDLTKSVPLIVRDGEELRFIHKTFIEFFAAEYVARDTDAVALLEKIYASPRWASFSVPAAFINEMSPELARSVITVPAAKVLLNMGLKGRLDRLRSLCFAFCWSVRWGGDNEMGDFYSENSDRNSLVKIGRLSGVIGDKEIGIGVKVRPMPDLGKLPTFAWKELTHKMPRIDVAERSRKKIELAQSIVCLRRGVTNDLSHEEMDKFLRNEVFAEFCSFLVSSMCLATSGSEFDGIEFDEVLSGAVVFADKNDKSLKDELQSLLG